MSILENFPDRLTSTFGAHRDVIVEYLILDLVQVPPLPADDARGGGEGAVRVHHLLAGQSCQRLETINVLKCVINIIMIYDVVLYDSDM